MRARLGIDSAVMIPRKARSVTYVTMDSLRAGAPYVTVAAHLPALRMRCTSFNAAVPPSLVGEEHRHQHQGCGGAERASAHRARRGQTALRWQRAETFPGTAIRIPWRRANSRAKTRKGKCADMNAAYRSVSSMGIKSPPAGPCHIYLLGPS